MDIYSVVYNLAPINVKNHEWDALMDTIYQVSVDNKCENLFYEKMIEYIKLVLAMSLLNKNKSITINDFLNYLHLLPTELYNKVDSSKDFITSDKMAIRKEIISKLTESTNLKEKQKVINITNSKQKK